MALIGGVCYRLAVTGGLTVDTGLGRHTRPLGPLTLAIAAPRDDTRRKHALTPPLTAPSRHLQIVV